MTDDWKTMRVPTDAWERAREKKEANGRTWGEQIVRPEDGDNDSTTDVDHAAIEAAAKRGAEAALEEMAR